MKEVPLGSIEGIGNGIPATFDYVEGEMSSHWTLRSSDLGQEKSHFEPFRFFFNRCMCRETEKRN